jgi:Tfp pilus assembly protein PilF
MALALRIRVTWQGDVIEDVVHEGARAVRVGAGERAQVVAPGDPSRMVHFRRRWVSYLPMACVAAATAGGLMVILGPVSLVYGHLPRWAAISAAWGTFLGALMLIAGSVVGLVASKMVKKAFRLEVPAGGADRIEFPGEEAIETKEDFRRILGNGCGRLAIGGSDVDFEVMRTERDYSFLYLTAGLGVIAVMALFAGSMYHIVRQWGDGHSPRWGEPVALGAEQAKFLRVTMDPGAQGASRLAAGEGLARHGIPDSLLVRDTKPEKKPVAVAKVPKKHHTPRKVAPPIPDENSNTFVRTVATNNTTDDDWDEDDEETVTDDLDDDDKAVDKDKLLTSGQQALLAAELRSAIDSLTAAEKTDQLDYDNLNWLGLAHYFLGQNTEAETRWNAALAMDPSRPDAVNNLGGIAKRRGDTAGEIAAYEKALALRPGDCHALNSMSLALAKQGKFDDAMKTLAESDTACGGQYAYTFIQRAGIYSLEGKSKDAMNELEQGLGKVDTLIPIKEYEVEADLLLDPAFAQLRREPAFETLTKKYLPRAVQSKQAILSSLSAPQPAPKLSDLKDPFANADSNLF